MLIRWQIVAVRWPISTSAFGFCAALMQSNQFWTWPRATQPSPSHFSASSGSGGFSTKSGGFVVNLLRLISILHFLADEDRPDAARGALSSGNFSCTSTPLA